jgi:hypothetical protein
METRSPPPQSSQKNGASMTRTREESSRREGRRCSIDGPSTTQPCEHKQTNKSTHEVPQNSYHSLLLRARHHPHLAQDARVLIAFRKPCYHAWRKYEVRTVLILWAFNARLPNSAERLLLATAKRDGQGGQIGRHQSVRHVSHAFFVENLQHTPPHSWAPVHLYT